MYREWKHVTRLTYILQFPLSVFHFLEAINHIILSNSGKYIFLHKAYEAITHEFLTHFIPQHIFDNVHCYEKQYLQEYNLMLSMKNNNKYYFESSKISDTRK
jgi:hypothetical protein